MRLSLFAAAALVASSIAAHADAVYTYTGQNFTAASDPYTTSDRVTGTFTLAAPFIYTGPGAEDFTPESFSFSDGVQTFTSSANLPFVSFRGSTDAQGNFESYDIDLSPNGADVILIDSNNGDLAANGPAEGNTTSPGILTEQTTTAPAVTPEPSSIALLGTGILGIAGVVKRRLT